MESCWWYKTIREHNFVIILMSNLYPFAHNGSFLLVNRFSQKMVQWLISNGSNSATRYTQSLDTYQITAADVFFPAMHITQFLKLPTSDSFSQSGSQIWLQILHDIMNKLKRSLTDKLQTGNRFDNYFKERKGIHFVIVKRSLKSSPLIR